MAKNNVLTRNVNKYSVQMRFESLNYIAIKKVIDNKVDKYSVQMRFEGSKDVHIKSEKVHE